MPHTNMYRVVSTTNDSVHPLRAAQTHRNKSKSLPHITTLYERLVKWPAAVSVCALLTFTYAVFCVCVLLLMLVDDVDKTPNSTMHVEHAIPGETSGVNSTVLVSVSAKTSGVIQFAHIWFAVMAGIITSCVGVYRASCSRYDDINSAADAVLSTLTTLACALARGDGGDYRKSDHRGSTESHVAVVARISAQFIELIDTRDEEDLADFEIVAICALVWVCNNARMHDTDTELTGNTIESFRSQLERYRSASFVKQDDYNVTFVCMILLIWIGVAPLCDVLYLYGVSAGFNWQYALCVGLAGIMGAGLDVYLVRHNFGLTEHYVFQQERLHAMYERRSETGLNHLYKSITGRHMAYPLSNIRLEEIDTFRSAQSALRHTTQQTSF